MPYLFPKASSWDIAALPLYLFAIVAGYLLGSIPFGVLLTRGAGTTDIRSIGSGNIGATNVLRTGRKDLAALTLLFDALKGTAAVVLLGQIAGLHAAFLAGFAAFLGHLYPVWLGFRGGKGVATYLGVAIGFWWLAALVFIVVWLLAAFVSRYSSLSALVASTTVPIVFFETLQYETGVLFFLATMILWWKHRPNIANLRAGTESKIGRKAASSP